MGLSSSAIPSAEEETMRRWLLVTLGIAAGCAAQSTGGGVSSSEGDDASSSASDVELGERFEVDQRHELGGGDDEGRSGRRDRWPEHSPHVLDAPVQSVLACSERYVPTPDEKEFQRGVDVTLRTMTDFLRP
jgi:hypothetical protein